MGSHLAQAGLSLAYVAEGALESLILLPPLCLVALVAYSPQTLLHWNPLLLLLSFLTLEITEFTLAPWGCGCQATAWHEKTLSIVHLPVSALASQA